MYPSQKLDRLPKPDLRARARDNRLASTRQLNSDLGLIPRQRASLTTTAPYDIINFQLPLAPQQQSGPTLPEITAFADVPSSLHQKIRELPPHVQCRLKSIRTRFSVKPHQAITDTILSIPLGFAIGKDTVSVYASYFITFISWWEWKFAQPSQVEQQYTIDSIFQFTKDLILAEYNDPLVYFNTIISILSQCRTPKGLRYLACDYLIQFDIETHRRTLKNYQRRFEPSQAPLISKSIFTHFRLSNTDAAVLLLWVYTACRISSIEGMVHAHSDFDNGTEITAHFSVQHLKGSLSNTHQVSVYCNCVTTGGADLLCCLHSPR